MNMWNIKKALTSKSSTFALLTGRATARRLLER